MERESVHELSAAYALDALDPDEREAFEEHLRSCERCREDVASFGETAAALAYAAPPAAPPPHVRDRILQQAHLESELVARRVRRRERVLGLALLPAAAAVAGLAVWVGLLQHRLDDTRGSRTASEQALAVLADPSSSRTPLQGAAGSLVVRPGGEAVLVVRRIAPAPQGKTYEAWVIAGGKPRPAGLLQRRAAILLSQRVPRGATVAMTVEPAGGSPQPTTKPFASAARA
jgi:anti-sigma-K factor RskA